LPGGEFDEVACDEHAAELRNDAATRLNITQKRNVRTVESPERLRRERLSGT
jgi:hypothetical protein